MTTYKVLTGMNQRCYGHVLIVAENEEDLRKKLNELDPRTVDAEFQPNGDTDSCDELDVSFIGGWPLEENETEGEWLDIEIDLDNPV